MNDHEIQLCFKLVRRGFPLSPPGIIGSISPDLMSDYETLFAANKILEEPISIISEAALVRTSMRYNEDDRIRTACVQKLLNSRSPVLECILFALLFDEDPAMQLTAVEGLVLIQSKHMNLAEKILAYDDSGDAYKTLLQHKNGKIINLYHLDPL